ncbi:TPA: hypothetical protein RUV46_002695 [Staphylococcus aureus]|nr:hypothetical protein [Staphylococcus aureus]
MKILIIFYVTFFILSVISALMSKPNSRVQKISLEIVVGLIGVAIIGLLAYWLVSSALNV